MAFLIPTFRRSAASEDSRPLGFTERIFAAAHAAGGGFQLVGVTGLEGDLPPEVLAEALERMRRRHPLLSVRLERGDGEPRFRRVEEATVPLRVLEGWPVGSWPAVAEAEATNAVPEDATPLWRATYLRAPGGLASRLVLTFHHAVCDGASYFRLLAELIDACQDLLAGEPEAEAGNAGLPPPIEDLAGSRFSWRVLGARLVERRAARAADCRLPIEHPAAPEDRGTGVMTGRLPAETTARLLTRVRRRGLPLHAVLSAAGLLALRELLPGGEALPMRCTIPVDLWRRADGGEAARHPVGCFVSGASARRAVASGGGSSHLWELAGSLDRDFAKQLAGRHVVDTVRTFGRVLSERALARQTRDLVATASGRRRALAVSNVGRIELRASDRLRATEVHMFASQHLLGSCLYVGAATFGGRLHLTFAYPRPLLSQESAGATAGNILRRLEEA